MLPEAIFLPVAALAIWTCLFVFWLGFKRVAAVRSRKLKPSDFRVGESSAVPVELSVMNRHLMNLLEMPVLFYVVCLAFYVVHQVSPGVVWLAIAFVASRFAHSWVHLRTNHILHRVLVFAVSNLLLLAMWVWFVQRVLA
jgi:hypothetical protein